MNETNLKKEAIESKDGTTFVNVDKLPISMVNHRFNFKQINWHDLLMLVDVYDRSKRYSTMVIEKGFNFYLLKSSTTALINKKLQMECMLHKHFNRSVCEELHIKNKFPILTTEASLIPLPSSHKTRSYSWFNANLLSYCIPYSTDKFSYLYTHGKETHLKVNASGYYLQNKFKDLMMIHNFIIYYTQKSINCINFVKQSRFNNPNLSCANSILFDDQIYHDIYLKTAKYMYEDYLANKKE
ncbi:hypothetical protein RZ75_10750 [Apilactobacillus kunkeei]|uniref:hypothetical protein n=1 Tax=Apilactobacillus kunkeei TaxID=148814 RepID=UPI0006B247E9|nr:hypothetical protein [Apilactobacillus kunkeei]KOY78575.1 hypothetical protein RZ75_10750 [Apilactobacillus kunkeei]